MIALVLFSLLLPLASWSAKPSADKKDCLSRELKRQDCRLQKGSYQVRLLGATIARDDGTWHMVDDIPLKGEGITWEKARFEFFKDWPILQLWLWDTGQGETKVQNLHWYVADARHRELKILAEGIVRRRRLKATIPPPPDPSGKEPPPPKPLPPIFDGEEKHSLKMGKQGELEWVLGSERKTLKKE